MKLTVLNQNAFPEIWKVRRRSRVVFSMLCLPRSPEARCARHPTLTNRGSHVRLVSRSMSVPSFNQIYLSFVQVQWIIPCIQFFPCNKTRYCAYIYRAKITVYKKRHVSKGNCFQETHGICIKIFSGFSTFKTAYRGIHEKGSLGYLCALGIERQSPLNECTFQEPFIWNQL